MSSFTNDPSNSQEKQRSPPEDIKNRASSSAGFFNFQKPKEAVASEQQTIIVPQKRPDHPNFFDPSYPQREPSKKEPHFPRTDTNPRELSHTIHQRELEHIKQSEEYFDQKAHSLLTNQSEAHLSRRPRALDTLKIIEGYKSKMFKQ